MEIVEARINAARALLQSALREMAEGSMEKARDDAKSATNELTWLLDAAAERAR